MADEKKYTPLTELLKSKDKISLEAALSGHDGFFPAAVQVPQADGKMTTRGQVNTTPQKNGAKRGRIILFAPTKEKVTIVRERVGQNYKGDWLHEVTTRDGHKFLASQKQLMDSV